MKRRLRLSTLFVALLVTMAVPQAARAAWGVGAVGSVVEAIDPMSGTGITIPAVGGDAAGDMLKIILVQKPNGVAGQWNIPSGWTVEYTTPWTEKTVVLCKISSGNQGAVAISNQTGWPAMGVMMRFTGAPSACGGVHASSQVEETDTVSDVVLPALSVSQDNTLILAIAVRTWNHDPAVSSWPNGLTNRVNESSDFGWSEMSLFVGSRVQTTAANLPAGTLNVTDNSVARYQAMMIAFSPAAIGDTQAPSAPSSLTATADNSAGAALSWSAATDNIAVDLYRIERCAGSNCSNFAQIGNTTSLAYTDTGLTPGTLYRYRVRAEDASNNLGPYSSIVSATAADTLPPSAPSNVSIASNSGTQLTVSWTASSDNVGVSQYLIERCGGASCSNFSQVATSASPPYADTGLSPSTTYSYRIRARDSANNNGGYSSVSSGTTGSASSNPWAYAGAGAVAFGNPLSTGPGMTVPAVGGDAAGDVLRIVLVQRINGVQGQWQTPSGWTVEYTTAWEEQATVLCKVSTGSQGAVNVVNDTGWTAAAVMLRFTGGSGACGGVHASAQIHEGDEVADVVFPALNVTQDNSLILAIAVRAWDHDPTITSWPNGLVNRINAASSLGSSELSLFVGTLVQTTAANLPSATLNITDNSTTRNGSILLAFSLGSGSGGSDATAPTVPAGLSANATSSSQISLSWTASTDAVGVVGYLVERCAGAGCSNFSQVATPAGPSLFDTGLAGATAYSYRVRARDAANNASAYSAVVTATTPPGTDTQPPSAPTGLTVTPGTAQMLLTWSAASDDVGTTIYFIERCQGTGCTSYVQIATTSSTTYVDTSIVSGVPYGYRVRAGDAAGNQGSYSGGGAGVMGYCD